MVAAPSTLYEYLRSGFPADLDKPALVLADESTISYRQLLRLSRRQAAGLAERGVGPGAVVAVQVEKRPEQLALYLAAARMGAVFLPLNPTYTDEEVQYFLADSGASALVCEPDRAAQLGRVAQTAGTGQVLTLSDLGAQTREQGGQPDDGSTQNTAGPRMPGPGLPKADVSGPALLLYTSGTTGRPKGAALTQANLIAMVAALQEAWAWSSGDVLLHALPLFHIHGLVVAATSVLRAGATMVLLPRFDLDAVLAWLPRCTLFMGVPTMYHRLAHDDRLTPDRCRGIRLFVSGSAPLSVKDFEAFRLRSGHTILERYGMTETGMLLSNPLSGPRKPGSVGTPLPRVEVRLVDTESLRDVAEGEVGEVWVRGPNVFPGYLRRPEATAASFVDGWFRTGDLAFRDTDGYYTLVGRARDLVITGGLNVYPAEVEAVLDAVPGVEESAVIGLPDEDLGERVTAVIVATDGRLTPDAVRQAARARLAPYKCPRQVEFVSALPRNAMGKVDKAALRRQFGAQ